MYPFKCYTSHHVLSTSDRQPQKKRVKIVFGVGLGYSAGWATGQSLSGRGAESSGTKLAAGATMRPASRAISLIIMPLERLSKSRRLILHLGPAPDSKLWPVLKRFLQPWISFTAASAMALNSSCSKHLVSRWYFTLTG